MTVDLAKTEPIDLHDLGGSTPLYDAVLTELGPLHDPVDTDYAVLQSQAVLALVERAAT